MTPRQLATLAFIDRYIREHGHSPSFQDIADGIGCKSKSGVAWLVRRLIERGYLRQIPNLHRGIEVARMPRPSEIDPAAAWSDPMSILRDAVEIVEVLADDRATLNGERCEVADDLLARIKAAVAASTPQPETTP